MKKPLKINQSGNKLRKKVAKGTLTMQHPGGLVSELFREKARERYLAKRKGKEQ